MWIVAAALARKPPPPPPDPPPAPEVARDLVARALASDEPWRELEVLSDEIGNRLAGSPELEAAVRWAEAGLRADGHEGVHLEAAAVTPWIRGEAALTLVSPAAGAAVPMAVLSLGNGAPTPPGGVQAPVLVVGSFEELEARAAEVPGRIVLFDVPFTTYGETVQYRWAGPSAAARRGAVAALVRSVGPVGHDTPHTGLLGYEDDAPKIPAAAVSAEAAMHLRRLASRGVPAVVHLTLGGAFGPDVTSHNVVAELRGRSAPEEVVLLGCHLDSWDVGRGAQDDGAGCMIVAGALDVLRESGLRPRRTVRVVLFTNEENGGNGARTYAREHAAEPIVAGLEMDLGAGTPLAVTAAQDPALAAPWLDLLRPLADALAPLGVTAFDVGAHGADVGQVLDPRRLPMVGIRQDDSGYWPIHHTAADTFDKIDRDALLRNVAAVAAVAWTLADAPALPGPATPPGP